MELASFSRTLHIRRREESEKRDEKARDRVVGVLRIDWMRTSYTMHVDDVPKREHPG